MSFGNVSTTQKKEAEEHGASCFSWEEFLQLVGTLILNLILMFIINRVILIEYREVDFLILDTVSPFLQGNMDLDLPLKNKTNICTIMYTSGTTGEPKGVIIKNEAFMTQVLSIDQILNLTDRVV